MRPPGRGYDCLLIAENVRPEQVSGNSANTAGTEALNTRDCWRPSLKLYEKMISIVANFKYK